MPGQFSPDTKTLRSAKDGLHPTADVATFKEVLTWDGHRGPVAHVAFSGRMAKDFIAAASRARLVPRGSSRDIATWNQAGNGLVSCPRWPVSYSVAWSTVYTGKQGDDRFNLYDYASGKLVGRLNVPANQDPAARGQFAPGGKFFILAGKDKRTGDIEHLFEVPSGKLLVDCQESIWRLSTSPFPVTISCLPWLVALTTKSTSSKPRRARCGYAWVMPCSSLTACCPRILHFRQTATSLWSVFQQFWNIRRSHLGPPRGQGAGYIAAGKGKTWVLLSSQVARRRPLRLVARQPRVGDFVQQQGSVMGTADAQPPPRVCGSSTRNRGIGLLAGRPPTGLRERGFDGTDMGGAQVIATAKIYQVGGL